MKNPKVPLSIVSQLCTATEESDPPPIAYPPHREPEKETPTCERCVTDAYLVYERITLVLDFGRIQPPCWDLAFWCGRCESVYGMMTTVPPGDRKGIQVAAENPRYVRYATPIPDTDSNTANLWTSKAIPVGRASSSATLDPSNWPHGWFSDSSM